MFRRRRKTYLEGIMEGRLRERRDAAHRIREYADHEEQRLAHRPRENGLIGNWLGGIRDAALVAEFEHPYFPPPGKPKPRSTVTIRSDGQCVCTCGDEYPCDQDPHPWKPADKDTP